MTIKELSDAIGIASRNIELQLAKLKKAERIERIGPDKGGYWKVNNLINNIMMLSNNVDKG